MMANQRTQLASRIFLLLALGALSGCATNGFVRKEVATGVEGAKGYTDTQVGDVRTRADQAMGKATLAERLALGNVDYAEISTHQVQFAFDDYRLDETAQSLLNTLVSELASHRGYVLEVSGYADATWPERYNYRLGRERADAVMRFLVTQHQVPSTRVASISFGEESPAADNETSDGRAQNRRVRVRLLELKSPGEPVSSMP